MPGRGLGLIGLLGGGLQSQGQGEARVEHEKGSIGFSPKLADQLNEVSQFAYSRGLVSLDGGTFGTLVWRRSGSETSSPGCHLISSLLSKSLTWPCWIQCGMFTENKLETSL